MIFLKTAKDILTGNIIITLVIVLSVSLILEVLTPIAPIQRTAAFGCWFLFPGYRQKVNNIEKRVKQLHDDRVVLVNNDAVVSSVTRYNSAYPQKLSDLLIAVENHRYRFNYVIDYPRLFRAGVGYILNRKAQGGSSGIIMQLARSKVALNDRTYTLTRKIKEIIFSLMLRYKYSLDELLTFHMNSVYCGSGVHGFNEASLLYFNKDISQLRDSQYLSLVAILNAPDWYLKDQESYLKRYLYVLEGLVARGFLTVDQQKYLADNSPVMGNFNLNRINSHGSYYYQSFVQTYASGTDTVWSYFDPISSSHLEKYLKQTVYRLRDLTEVDDLNGFIIAGQNGNVTTLIGGIDYLSNRHNYALDKSTWYPGSLMKLFSYARLFEDSNEDINLPVKPVIWELDDGIVWPVKNYNTKFDHFEEMPAVLALSRSLNVSASYLASKYYKILHNRISIIPGSSYQEYPAVFLGAEASSPLWIWQLLQCFVEPAYGSVSVYLNTSKENSYKSLIPLFNRRACKTVAQCMSMTVDDPYGTANRLSRDWGYSGSDVRVKTGTAQDHRSASLYFTLPKGFSILVGVFSESNKSLLYKDTQYGVTGSSLLPLVNQVLSDNVINSNPAKKQYRSTSREYLKLAEAFQPILN
ncbi:MAG: penicillin-binding protein [Calditrichaeota bacterium]|nr:penicillin-binding protein [Calditrichota bacterium]